MGWGNLPLLLLGTLVLLLVSAGIEDVRTREIANWKNAAIALIAPLWWVARGLAPWPDMALQIGLAVAVFSVFALVFAMGGSETRRVGQACGRPCRSWWARIDKKKKKKQ